MTDEQSAAEDPAAAHDQPGGGRPPLTRDESHRVVAGVCGGLGRYLDIDPVVFRVVTAVLCLTGGLGLFVYGLAWLIVPTEQGSGADGGKHGRTELQRVLTGRVDGQSIGAVLLTVIGTGVFFSWMGSGDSVFPLLLLGAMIFFAVRHDPERRRRARGLGRPPRAGGPYDRPTDPGTLGGPSALADWKTWRQDFHTEWHSRKAEMREEWATHKAELHERVNLAKGFPHHAGYASASAAAADAADTATDTVADTPPSGRPDGPSDTSAPPSATGYLWDPRHPERNPYGASPPPGAPAQPWWQRTDLPEGDPLRKSTAPRPDARPARRARRSRSVLAPLGLVASVGAAWAVWSARGGATATSTVLVSTVLATGLLGLGLTMLLGAKFGRARVLAVPALLVTMALVALGNSGGTADRAFGDRSWTPTSAAAVQPQYALGAGAIRLDLGAVDPGHGTVTTAARLGAGDVHVTVPPDVDVALDVRTLVGTVHLPDRTLNGGVGTDRKVHLAPVAGAVSKGTIDLTLEVGFGDIQVVRG